MINDLLHTTPGLLVQFAAGDLEKTISDLSMTVVAAGSVALLILIALAVLLNKRWPQFKPALFSLVMVVVIGTTLTISGGTIYLNANSATGGPVHWHADIEFWACDNELEIRDPNGVLSNKIGTPTLHEHNDKRIHLEGVPVTLPEDASLGKFMNVLGGEISPNTLKLPLNDEKYFENTPEEQDGDGNAAPAPEDIEPYIKTERDGKYAEFTSGAPCGDMSSEVQLFALRYDSGSKTYTQTKISDPADYEIAHHSDVPPGDCLIVEFGPARDRTDKLCQQYGIRDRDRCEQFGVKPEERQVCGIKEAR